ncbi:thermonuclease family protein [Sphingomonas sp. Leaf339]|uniref:thermonuclease family protein n=1 Tax=Sphingomonas sp. Leaf339 TaxID=1736343 RepID=UPI0039E03FC6
MGIDAPELPGHCRQGRACAPGDPYRSTESLRAAMQGRMTIQRYKQDRYGRTIATIAGNKGDLSCWQLKHRQAIYKPKWDEGGIVASLCPAALD